MNKPMHKGFFYQVPCTISGCKNFANVIAQRHSLEQRRAAVDVLKKHGWVYLSKTRTMICPDCRNVSVEPEAPEKLESKGKELAGVE